MVSINNDLCIGCGMCESIMPEVFKINNEMKAEVIRQPKNKIKLKEVIECCPVSVIRK